MPKLHTYLVVRHGSNGANQHMTPRAVIGTIEATSRDLARDLAQDRWVFYNNQHAEVIPLSRATAVDRRHALELDALHVEW